MRILLVSTAILFATPSVAQDSYDTDPPPVIELSGEASVMTDYRFRGISYSDGDVAARFNLEAHHASGFYAGVGARTVGGGPQAGDLEFEPYAGWKNSIAPLIDLDVGIARRIYTGVPAGLPSDYWEPYAGVVGQFGPAKLRLGAAWAPGQDALLDEDNLYLSADAEFGLPFSPLTVEAHVGQSEGPLSAGALVGPGDSTTDWSVGARYTFLPALTARVQYIGNDANSVDGLTDDTVVGSVIFRF